MDVSNPKCYSKARQAVRRAVPQTPLAAPHAQQVLLAVLMAVPQQVLLAVLMAVSRAVPQQVLMAVPRAAPHSNCNAPPAPPAPPAAPLQVVPPGDSECYESAY